MPVVLAAFGLAFSAQAIGGWIERIGRAEAIARKITGAIFIAVGFYYTLVYIFRVL